MDRLRIFQLIIYGAVILIIIRLFYWQFISDASSHADAYTNEITLPATRGEILSSDGFPLVANQQSFILYGKPNEISQNQVEVAKKLAPFLIKVRTLSHFLRADALLPFSTLNKI